MKWIDLVQMSAEKSRLKVLEILWNKKATAEEIVKESGVPYTTVSRTLLLFFKHGLVSRKRKDSTFEYKLNSLGSLVATVLIQMPMQKSKIKGISAVRYENDIFVGRHSELETIKNALQKGKHILITGPAGIGKTALLQTIKAVYQKYCTCFYFPDPKPAKSLLLKLCKKLKIKAKMVTPTFEILSLIKENVENNEKPIILLIDDIHEVTKSSAKEITKLMEMSNIIIISAGLEEPIKHYKLYWNFKEKLELKPLTPEETKALVSSKINLEDQRYSKQIYMKTKGIPLAVVEFLDDMEAERSEGRNINEIVDRIESHPSTQAKKIDLFPVFGIIAIAYLLLAMRYVARASDNMTLYLMSGTLGFIMLAMVRYTMYYRRKAKK